MTRFPSSAESPTPLPAWMRWGGAALTGLVAVLFVVVLLQVKQQSQRIQSLQDKVQSLENSRDLDRTGAMEEQLRSTVERLQSLEGLEQAVQRLSNEQASLRNQLGRASREPVPEPVLEPSRPPALPQLPAGQP